MSSTLHETGLSETLSSLEQFKGFASAGNVERGAASLLDGSRIGLEKENLRVQADGVIAQSDHPAGLGSALCNPYITTDYSEALLELVTPALQSTHDALDFLHQTQRLVQRNLAKNEFVWNTSMPCLLGGSDNIRVGCYGDSYPGRMKSVYRRGLGLRYGRSMQTIAGIHFNYSWPETFWQAVAHMIVDAPGRFSVELVNLAARAINDSSYTRFTSEMYLCATRNVLRRTWLIPLLFGASPAVCRTFMEGKTISKDFAVHGNDTLYQRYATSLRMGDIGYNYSKKAAESISVDYSDLASYTNDLHRLITTEHDSYAELGLLDEAGEHQQLNLNLLQIENEYYSPVRPKQLAERFEPPVVAMRSRGILYLELRCIDVNMLEPAGMSQQQLDFFEIFLLQALLDRSPPIDKHESRINGTNISTVAHRGRDPQANVIFKNRQMSVRDAAAALLSDMQPVAEFLDKHRNTAAADAAVADRYSSALRSQQEKVANLDQTPSAVILDELLSSGQSFIESARAHSNEAASFYADLPADEDTQASLQQAVDASTPAQRMLEEQSTGSFEDYLDKYFKQLQTLSPVL